MARLTRVEPKPAHRLYVEFSDGVRGEVDLSQRLFGPVFAPLEDEAFFRKVTLDEYGAPCWPNGADLAPDALYEMVRQERANPAPAP